MSIGITGVSIAPELGLHFHSGSLSFFERCCCCTGTAQTLELDDAMYIDYKLRVMRWQDKREVNGFTSTHARLKLIVVDRLHKVSHHPFQDAEKAFQLSEISWHEPQIVKCSDLEKLSTAISIIKQSILENPLD